MRSEYVIPLQVKMAARLEKLAADIEVATSTVRRITFDLDDGVRGSYSKFGDLLAEMVAVHGQKLESL